MPKDSPTRLKGPLSGDKRVAWSEPLRLSDVKAIGHALGCSVNDVLLASVTGALRAYLASKGDTTDGVEVRALIPVNLRPSTTSTDGSPPTTSMGAAPTRLRSQLAVTGLVSRKRRVA